MKKKLLSFVLFTFFSPCFILKAQWTSMGSGVSIPQRTLAGIAPVNKNIIWGFTWHASQFVPTHEFTRTSDGGQTWHAGPLSGVDPDQFVIYLFPLDSQTAWLATADEKNPIKGKIYKTTDGGASWMHQTTGFTGFNETPAGVYFWNENEGVAYGATGEASYNDQIAVYTTTDGGANWIKVVAPNMPAQLPGEGMSLYNLAGFFCVVGDTFWFGTTKKRVFKSADRGKSWQVFSTPLTSSNYISSIGFRDGQTGLAIGYNPLTIARSTDGGATWAKLPLTVPSSFRGAQIEYVPGTNSTWYMMTSPTKYMVSYNDGDSWETFDSNIEPWSLEFLDAKTGFAASYITNPAQGGAYRWTGAPLANRWFVNDDASGAGNGRRWADAFPGLQSALAVAGEGDQIWVAEGTYKPDAPGGSPAATFLINKDIRLYGGFAGTETALAQRGNPAEHPTVLSGDLNGDDLPNDFVTNRGDNVEHVVQVTANVTAATLTDGFSIRNGQADGTQLNQQRGAGLYAFGSLAIRNCSFTENFANLNGGGMIARNLSSIDGTSIEVSHCAFENNRTGSDGGGLSFLTLGPNATYTVTDCQFMGNRAQSEGGGLAIQFGPNASNPRATVENCHFQGNEVEGSSGAFLLDVNENANNAKVLVDSCMFLQNHATEDIGGFGLRGEGKNMDIEMNACHFTGNTAGSESGGADFLGTAGATGKVEVDSCLFENNSALYTGGLLLGNYHTGGAQVNYQLTNSTFVNNQSMDYGGAIELITGLPSKCNFLVENCLIENNSSAGNSGGIDFVPSTTETHATFRNTRVINNHCAGEGGAIRIYQYLQNLPFPANASCIFENCLLAGNTSAGAAISADSMPNLQFLNCTIAGNSGGGIQLSDQSGLRLQNTILHNPGFLNYEALTADVSYTSGGGNLSGDLSLSVSSTDKQNTDPLLSGDFHILAGSPCIDMGVDLGNLPALDLDGNPRVFGTAVDMGAYESGFTPVREVITGEVGVSPNPAVAFLNIQLPKATAGQFEVEVFDAPGKLLRRQSLAEGQTLDVQGLAAGMYALKVVAGERVYVGRFVKW